MEGRLEEEVLALGIGKPQDHRFLVRSLVYELEHAVPASTIDRETEVR